MALSCLTYYCQPRPQPYFQSVRIVCDAEKSNEQHMLSPNNERQWINPSKRLVDSAIARWNGNNLRADNTSVVTVMLDPPGPPRAQVSVVDT